MKTPLKLFLVFATVATFIWACSSNDDMAQMVDDDLSITDDVDPTDDGPGTDDDGPVGGDFEMVDVQVTLPDGSDVDLTSTILFTLAMPSEIKSDGKGELPFNTGTGQLTYLLDADDNLLLAGFLTDDRKEISVATTTEVMLYFSLGYALEQDEIKAPYIDAVQQIRGFSNLVSEIGSLFVNNPLMYKDGDYVSAINTKIDEITAFDVQDIGNRIEVDNGDTRSGVTISDIDSENIQIQNSYPRRAHTFVYKKSSTDENGNVTNFSENLITDFELEAGGRNSGASTVAEGGVTQFSQCNVASTIIENTTSQNINLPLSDGESSAEYEVVVVGPGTQKNGSNRAFTATEQAKFEELSKEAFILDNFLPALLDIGGNKGLLPNNGDAKEMALVNTVLPYLEANPTVLDLVLQNDFDAASKEFIPFLYEDIRQSNDLRELLKGVYDTVDGGDFPDTFIQSQELIETHEARLKSLYSIIDRNIKSNENQCNNYRMGDTANLESWTINSIDGKVKVGPECLNILFNESGEISVAVDTELGDGQTLEYDWTTTRNFRGNIQDINGDPSNSGASITTTEDTVSFSTGALASDLSDGENIENVTVTAYVKNADGSRSEVGSDQMKVNIMKLSFILSPDDVCQEGGQSVVLYAEHQDGETTIPSADFDYKLVWSTSGQYGKFSGRNTVETLYNTNSISFASLDREVENGVDNVSVKIYARAKGSGSDYTLVDDAQGKVATKNDPECDFKTLALEKEFLFEPSGTDCDGDGNAGDDSYSGNIIVTVPKDENATRYTVAWTETYQPEVPGYYNLGSETWTNDTTPSSVIDDGDSFRVYAGFGNGAACANNTQVPRLIESVNAVRGYATLTICYD